MKPDSLAFSRPIRLLYRGSTLLALAWLVVNVASAQAANFTLGTSALLEGPGMGGNSVVLAASVLTPWTATANATWLHLSAANQSGAFSRNVVFSYDANPGATRTGTLTIAGLTLTVTQAASTYVAAQPVTTLVSSGLNNPNGVAVDGLSNVYIADSGNNAIKWWSPTTGNVTPLVSSGLNNPNGVAVDGSGNVYIADSGNNAIKVWALANNTVTTLVSGSPELDLPEGVAVDGPGAVYIADTYNNAIQVWVSANNTVTTLVSSGLDHPYGVAVDRAGNVYIADTVNNAIKEWSSANNTVTTLVSSGLFYPYGVAVDGSGNVYIADSENEAIKEWSPIYNTVTTLVSSGLYEPHGVAVDGADNVYIADYGNSAVKELPYAFVDPTPKSESSAAGSDVLPVVLPATENLLAPFAPTSSQPWLTISGVTNGVVSFAFTANTGNTNRTANITVLGETIPVTQNVLQPFLVATARLEGPTAGVDSVVVVLAISVPWTATANATWLHLSAANQSGAGSANVVFSYDANPGATRTGTLTIAGLTLTVTQAASTYVVAQSVTLLVSSGLNSPFGVAVDGAGNVYIADTYNNAIKEWSPANNTVTPLVSSGLDFPYGVAVDGSGNVYIADTVNNAIKEWTRANNTVTTLVSSGLDDPYGVAVDGAGNVYIADFENNAIKEWSPANHTVTTLVSSGLFGPSGVAVDGAGNVYIADTYHNAIKEWSLANHTVTPLVSSGLSSPIGVAVDGAGNVYIADTFNNAIKEWSPANNTVTPLVSSGLSRPYGVAVDGLGNVYIADSDNNAVKELTHAFVDPTPKSESPAAGSDVLPVVLPATENLLAPFAPTSSQPWLTISGVTNGVVSFAFTANTGNTNRTANITVLGETIPVTQNVLQPFLVATARLEGPTVGVDSVVVVLAISVPWTATANATWLHLSAANQSGAGSTNVVFSYDANPGATRTGTLTIAGLTLTVTQAGSTYVAAQSVTPLVSSGLDDPSGVAVDGLGNVYIADPGNNAIKEWTRANNTVTTLVASGLKNPDGVAVDGSGNVYMADTFNNAIKEWSPANNTVTPLVASGLNQPFGVAVDGLGNVYFADTGNGAIKEWSVANSNVTTLLSSGLRKPNGVAVDGAGNVYIADTDNNAIKEWTATTGNVTTLVSSGLNEPRGVAVDGTGNVYIADTLNNAVKELTHAFVDPTPKSESPAAGSDVLPVVLPATENLLAPFAPTSSQPWLTISGVTNGVVSFAFTANTGNTNRTANITVLGETIPVTQNVLQPFLVATARLEGPTAGVDSVVLAAGALLTAPWTATANATWLHLSAANQSGAGSANVVFSYDANPGATRTGTLTIAGLTLTVTQAGSTYVAAQPVTTLASSGLYYPFGVAVDGAGNVYIADTESNEVKEWTRANNTVTTLVASGLRYPDGVAVDGSGNVYIADGFNNAIKEWSPANKTVTTLVASGLNEPFGVAVDGSGNVYIADSENSAIKEWSPANNTVTPLVSSGLAGPFGVAVDGAGNVYIADTGNNAIKEWSPANNTVTTLVSSGLMGPFGVAVDGAGNVYIADSGNNAIKEWSPANNTVTTLVSSGLMGPYGVAVDGAGNVYIADTGNIAVKELPYAFVDPTAKTESPAAGSDVLPVVLPATENLLAPFAPTSSQPWLTLSGVNNGVVSFTFTATVTNRPATITLLGQTISITQTGIVPPPTLISAKILGNGVFQFAFTNANPSATFTVLSTTNLSLPLTNWTVIGTASNIAPGQLQFTDTQATNSPRFYTVRSP